MKIDRVPVKSLTMDPANVRTHDDKNMKAIKASLNRFGQQKPIVVDANGIVVAGNGTLAAADSLGWAEISTVSTELNGAEAIAYAIADNRTAELADWDDESLAKQLSALQLEADELLEAAGFSAEELAALVDEVTGITEGNTDADDVPEVPEVPTAQPGQIWRLGDHRLMCGDSTRAEDVAALMDGEKADLVFTDPPYNIAEKNKGVASGCRDAMDRLMGAEWDKGFSFKSVAGSIISVMGKDCTVYICTSHHLAGEIWEWMAQWAEHSNYCVWAKPAPMPSLMRRHWTWSTELVCYGTRGAHTFNFPDQGHALSVWTMANSAKNDLHPTQKPVHIPTHAISHSSKPGGTVVDLFMGSGSTLIACEQTGRRCYGMEISPNYCDVILRRWEEFTGGTAEVLDG